MSSRERIQNYLRRNRIQELFEEMMQKVVHDFPANPVNYLIEFLEKKNKEQKNITRNEKSIGSIKSKTPKHNLSATMNKVDELKASREKQATNSIDLSRSYDKPWKTGAKSPSKSKLAATTDGNFKSKSKLKKSKEFVKDETITNEEDADVDLGLVYGTPKVVGEPMSVNIEEDELLITQETTSKPEDEKPRKKMSAKEHKKKRLAELKALTESSNTTKESFVEEKEEEDDYDGALEMLEDADALMDEGVKNPVKSGFVTSSNSSKKEEFEIVLNMSKFFDELGGTVPLNADDANEKKSVVFDDEEFESASQVTGPRAPVWEAPKSDVMSTSTLTKEKVRDKIDLDMFDIRSQNSITKAKSIVKSPTPSESSRTKKQRPKTADNIASQSLPDQRTQKRKSSASSRVSARSVR